MVLTSTVLYVTLYNAISMLVCFPQDILLHDKCYSGIFPFSIKLPNLKFTVIQLIKLS